MAVINSAWSIFGVRTTDAVDEICFDRVAAWACDHSGSCALVRALIAPHRALNRLPRGGLNDRPGGPPRRQVVHLEVSVIDLRRSIQLRFAILDDV